MSNALIINEKDHVAVVIEEIKVGEEVEYRTPEGNTYKIIANQDIPIFHKIAVKAIEKGKPVIKYGEHIGKASEDISVGSHVHVHNVENMREDLHV